MVPGISAVNEPLYECGEGSSTNHWGPERLGWLNEAPKWLSFPSITITSNGNTKQPGPLPALAGELLKEFVDHPIVPWRGW